MHERVRREMLAVYRSEDMPSFLDPMARDLLSEGRANFFRLGLDRQATIQDGTDTILFPWTGDRIMNTMLMQLRSEGLSVGRDGVALCLNDTPPAQGIQALKALAEMGPADPVLLAASVLNKWVEKHDRYLDEELLSRAYASAHLDTQGAWETIRRAIDPAR